MLNKKHEWTIKTAKIYRKFIPAKKNKNEYQQ